MYKLLKCAGFIGVGEGILFAISGIAIAALGLDHENIAPYAVSIVIGSVIVFGGCLVLALNEIGNKKPGV